MRVPFEIETKYHLSDDVAGIKDRVSQLAGTEFAEALTQIDRYFDHPARSFAETDEAFRIRSVGRTNRVTYKGPRLSSETKTRREIEIAFAEGTGQAETMEELVTAMGFKVVRTVEKVRRKISFAWQLHAFDVVLDEVVGLGSFAEIETVVDDETELGAAESAVLALADKLGLSSPVHESYLGMLIRQESEAS